MRYKLKESVLNIKRENKYPLLMQINIEGDLYYYVAIFKNLRELRRFNVRYHYRQGLKPLPQKVEGFTCISKSPRNGKLGFIVFIANPTDRQITHECFHAVMHWARYRKLNFRNVDHEELMARVQTKMIEVFKKAYKDHMVP